MSSEAVGKNAVPKTGGSKPSAVSSKEEMRARIKASLAARSGLDDKVKAEQPKTAPPSIAGNGSAPQNTRNTGTVTGNVAVPGTAPTHRPGAARIVNAQSAASAAQGTGKRSVVDDQVAQTSRNRKADRKTAYWNESGSKSYAETVYETRYRERSSKVGLVFGIIGIVILAGALIAYLVGMLAYSGKFLPNTYINGINIAGMTSEQANAAIITDARKDGITFKKKDGETVNFTSDEYGSTVWIPEGGLNAAATENRALWFVKYFQPTNYTIHLNSSYSEELLANLIATYPWGSVAPQDAEIVEDGSGKFKIQPEDNGDMVDTDILTAYTETRLRGGSDQVDMVAADCYLKANVVESDLEDTLELYNAIGNVDITFDMTNREDLLDPTGKEVLEHTQIVEWLTATNGDLNIDTGKAKAWVEQNIVQKYETFYEGYQRKFRSTKDGTLTVEVGRTSTYGWATDVDETVNTLIETIKGGKSKTIEPVYSQEGFRMESHGDNEDYAYTGKTYIEVSKERQHMWMYVDGELIIESDVVTGKKTDPDRATPAGVYQIWDRAKNIVLGTYEVQGYEQPVDYWMAIDHTGIGLHDLSRRSYGGSTYVNNGSHGCINLPLKVAATVYEHSCLGFPVIITED